MASLSRPTTPSSHGFYRQFPMTSVVTPSQNSNGMASNRPVITSPTHSMASNPHSTPQSQQTNNLNNSQNKSLPKPNLNNNNLFNSKPTSESGPLPPKRIESKVTESNKSGLNSLKPVSEQPTPSILKETKDLPTPSSTPTTARKTRRRSNLFPPLTNKKHLEEKYKNGELGSGRAIPVCLSSLNQFICN
jgi:Arf-GAP/GTPase/ANK repeat/PH domain-containing protein 1/3